MPEIPTDSDGNPPESEVELEELIEPGEFKDVEESDEPVELATVHATTAVESMDKPRGHTITELITIAKVAMSAPWMVKDLTTVEEAAIKMMYGQELGLGPMFSLRHVYVVQGTPALSAGLVGALIQKSGYYWKVSEHTDEVCEIEFYTADNELIGVSKFTMEDAKTAGLVRSGSGWSKYPRNMLYARALTNGARWYTPAVFNGPIYTPEELRDSTIEETPASSWSGGGATKASPVPAPSIPAGRTPYPADREQAIKDGWEPCPEHPDKVFFKRGKMRQIQHPTGERHERKPWCSHEDKRVEAMNKVIRKMDDKSFPSEENYRTEWVTERLTDLGGVAPDEWRIVDLVEIERLLDDDTV